jgi:uncharacterized protein
MVGRKQQIETMQETLRIKKSSFVAVTGRRRVGKTYLIEQVYATNLCLLVTGIQAADKQTQINNFTQKIAEYAGKQIVVPPKNWQQVFSELKNYLKTLPKNKKQVIFLDELPWISTNKSGFLQMLAHLWNDYLSKENHFVLVVCGSATSWIIQKVVNDKGGLHNRITHSIALKPFTLSETKAFLVDKKIQLTNNAIVMLYMTFGGIPFYLEKIKRGESPAVAIERICFSETATLKNEYENLYKALFENSENHEAIVAALANAKAGLSAEEIVQISKVAKGGPFIRTINDLMLSGFIQAEAPYGKVKRGTIYRLVDEFSVFYHKFMKRNKKTNAGIWLTLTATQQYKIWTGYAFETICLKHISEIKKALGIANVYTENASFKQIGNENQNGFQIDLIIDRKDQTINLCECKFYESPFEIDKKYATQLQLRKSLFKKATGTRKIVFNTLITNYAVVENANSIDSIDNFLTIDNIM